MWQAKIEFYKSLVKYNLRYLSDEKIWTLRYCFDFTILAYL